jgi:hypothetical protein
MPNVHDLARRLASRDDGGTALSALAFRTPTSAASPAAGILSVNLDSMAIPDNVTTSLTFTVHPDSNLGHQANTKHCQLASLACVVQ